MAITFKCTACEKPLVLDTTDRPPQLAAEALLFGEGYAKLFFCIHCGHTMVHSAPNEMRYLTRQEVMRAEAHGLEQHILKTCARIHKEQNLWG